jgi:hypothetical protein
MGEANRTAISKAEQSVFGIFPGAGGQHHVLSIAIPALAWDKVLSHEVSQTFDLRRYGMPLVVMLWGAKDRATIMDRLGLFQPKPWTPPGAERIDAAILDNETDHTLPANETAVVGMREAARAYLEGQCGLATTGPVLTDLELDGLVNAILRGASPRDA